MHNATITELWIFPIKGCQGIQVDAIHVDKSGVKGDRDFAFWAEGKIIDQVCTPKMAAIAASLNDDQTVLTLRNETLGEFELTIDQNGKKLDSAQVLDKYQSIDQGDAVAEWASKIVGKEVRLVIPGETWKINLPVPSLADMHNQDKKKFFAVSSVSLTNAASLEDLNKRLAVPVNQDRFRSNVVVGGMDPWEEDNMGVIFTDDVELNHMSGAERCVIVTTDQKTGLRPKNNMLQVLKEFRLRPREERFASGLLFGDYLSVTKSGTLKTGDVFQHRPAAPAANAEQNATSQKPSNVSNTENALSLPGHWDFTIFETPAGDQHCKIEFIVNGNKIIGKVTGSELINSSSATEEVELDECTVQGNSLNFIIEIVGPIELPLICAFEINDDEMSGTAQLGALGTFAAKASKNL